MQWSQLQEGDVIRLEGWDEKWVFGEWIVRTNDPGLRKVEIWRLYAILPPGTSPLAGWEIKVMDYPERMFRKIGNCKRSLYSG